ncbi:MAG: capsule assembly Wzi family protein [Prevotella sp.]|nr:capsule assembly Wzi family protein [Prevotella sp.]
MTDFLPIHPLFSQLDSIDDSNGYQINWFATTEINAGSGQFAPRLISANNGGLITQPVTILERAGLRRPIDKSKRFSYSFGVQAVADASKSTSYRRWNNQDNQFFFHNERPAAIFIQELYGEVKFRGVYLMVGMKENDRSIFDSEIASGDLTLSNNARPIPQVRVGFIDFQNIPFTNGWVQIQGDIAYGKFRDSKWLDNHYNFYNNYITTGAWYHYKRCYFRTNPDKPFSFTVGMQHASQFGGTRRYYSKGKLTSTFTEKVNFKDFINIFYQTKGNDSENIGEAVNFYGNHLGSWDIQMRYRFHNGSSLTAYMQKPWEDESGIAWQTGFDGVWGLRYDFGKKGIVEAIDIEYLDFTNQGGPILWDPTDLMPNKATGSDNYYNNFMYNGWANYGVAIGSPIFKAPIYNTDGYLCFKDNHLRGFHVGIKGSFCNSLSWRALLSYISSNGRPTQPRAKRKDVTSFLAEASYALPSVNGLSIKAQMAFDAGSLYQPCFGVFASVAYVGNFSFKR